MTAPDLKPCPFCGHHPYDDLETEMIMGARTGHKFAVACSWCEVLAPGADTRVGARGNWNTRTPDPAAIREALFSLPAVYAHQINTGVREVYDPLQRFYTMESVLSAITEATK